MLHQYRGSGGQSSKASVTGQGGMAAAATTFSLFFPLQSGGGAVEEDTYCTDEHHSGSTVTASASPSPSPVSASSFSSAGTVVDCTLSLETPSSHRAEPVSAHPYPSVSALAAVSCWDAAVAAESYYYQQQGKHGATCRGAAGHDQFMDRRCASCGTSSTPLWRNGPRGPKSLCNACGIRFKKEEQRAAEGSSGGGGYTAHHHHQQQRAPCVAVAYGDADAWRLNVVVPPAPAAFSAWPERASCLFQHN